MIARWDALEPFDAFDATKPPAPATSASLLDKTIATITLIRWMKRARPGERPVRRIIAAAADCFHVAPAVLLGRSREQHIAHPRMIAIAIAHAFGAGSLPEIGRRFGGRDHTTVLHAVRRFAPLVQDALAALAAADEGSAE